MREFILDYYVWLSGLASAVVPPLRQFTDAINIPLLSALLFGLMGALAPCQLSTNVAALAFVTRSENESRRTGWQVLAFVAGKVTVYALIGGLVVASSLRINQVSETVIPVVVLARRALGPLLIVVGLFMLGVLRLHVSVGANASRRLEQWVGEKHGLLPSYLLGVAFSFTFCPTLFMLFFGLTVPLAIASPAGVVLPGVFAVGTVLPVLVLAGVVASGRVALTHSLKRIRRANALLQRFAAVVLIVVGLHELVLYWFL